MRVERADRTLAGLAEFYAAPPVSTSTGDTRVPWDLFRDAAAGVPAYARFLAGRGVDPATVTDWADVPLLTKENYLRCHPLHRLCRDGRLDAADTVALSSGSSGRPTVWPRTVLDELVVARRFEHALYASFRADERSTLIVVCFALGNWVGGMYTAAACRHLAETPLSVHIRRFLAAEPATARALFGESRLPTLVQYDPASRFFETHGGTLLFTGREAVALPFVYVFGRSLFTVSFFGANIYPENVTVALERPDVSGWVTGKFVLSVVTGADEERRMSVVVELAPGVTPAPHHERLLADAVSAELRRLNSEFAHYVPDAYQTPLVVLRPAGDAEHFPPGVKHRYTRPST